MGNRICFEGAEFPKFGSVDRESKNIRTSRSWLLVVASSLLVAATAVTAFDFWEAASPADLVTIEVADKSPLQGKNATHNVVPIRVINSSSEPIWIVGRTACRGWDCDFGSKSMPIEIKGNGQFEFVITLNARSPDTTTGEVDFYVAVSDQLVTKKMSFSIEMEEP